MHEVAARRCPTALTPSFPRCSSRYEIRTGRQTDAFFLLMQHDPRHVAADGGKSVRYEDAHGGEEGGPKVRDPPTPRHHRVTSLRLPPTALTPSTSLPNSTT